MKDLGVIPQTFPTIGDFGGVEQIGDGRNNLQIDSNYNMRYIAADNTEVTADQKVDVEDDIHTDEHPVVTTEVSESNVVEEDAHTFQAAPWRM